jgi:hypothetical protein
MTAIHSQAPHGGWRRISRRQRPASGLVQRALAAVRDWRRRLQDRNRSSALDERTLRDSGICRSDELQLDREQIERDAWLETLRFPPFLTRVPITEEEVTALEQCARYYSA